MLECENECRNGEMGDLWRLIEIIVELRLHFDGKEGKLKSI